MTPKYVSTTNPSLVRTLISEDPSIYFNGTVNDATANTHTLVTIAIGLPNQEMPVITYSQKVGDTAPLYSLVVKTAVYVNSNLYTPSGTITMADNVTTAANQTYSTNQFNLTSNTATILKSVGGVISITADVAEMPNGMRLDFSYSNKPVITVTTGLNRLQDIVKDVPQDIGAGVINKLLKTQLSSTGALDSKEIVEGEVNIGDIDNVNQSILCDNADTSCDL